MTPEPGLEPPARPDSCTAREPEPPPSLSDCGQGGQIALRGAEMAMRGSAQVDEFPSLAKVLGKHTQICGGFLWSCECGVDWDENRDITHAAHQADAWREACTIRTVEQLDAGHLTAWGTLIAEIHTPDDDCLESNCWIVPVVWEMVNQMGWMCHNDRPLDAEPKLPALLIWHPDWARP